ncbi:MAG TPA: glycosyltransferase family 4 protein, partial [Sphingomicrobium sp.]|nr:glycosyltransferase family 4 protein [Sphingomicrobium sp.]
RVDRGAEVAFIEVARQLSLLGHEVTLFGSGDRREGEPYQFVHVPAVKREHFERWPKIPTLRNETSWEEATFAPGLLARYRPSEFDVVATCAYPYTHWALGRRGRGKRPKRVFITQNGDWPAYSDGAEFRLFRCDGLVCTNPDYLERNKHRYRCALIPNGVDLKRFQPGEGDRARFGFPQGPVVLMVSALISSKNVAEGVAAVARIAGVTLAVAGDGPLRDEIRRLADELMPGRYMQLTVPAAQMPALYRSADVFMHLSVDESFGNVFVEALASGIPIVAYDTPRTRWILGEEGILADKADPDALFEALKKALDRDCNAGKIRERAKRFSWEAIAKDYEQFFGELGQQSAV